MNSQYSQELTAEFQLDRKSLFYLESIDYQLTQVAFNPLQRDESLRLTAEVASDYEDPAKALQLMDSVVERLLKTRSNILGCLRSLKPYTPNGASEKKHSFKIRLLERKIQNLFSPEEDTLRTTPLNERSGSVAFRSDMQYHGSMCRGTY